MNIETKITTLIICLTCFLSSCQTRKQKQINTTVQEQANEEIRRQSAQSIIIPMDLSFRRPVVELMINGKGPYKFIFDTGSMTHVIDEKLVREMELEVVGEDPLITPGSNSKLVSKRYLVPKVGFSQTNLLKDLEMNAINLRSMLPYDGILSGMFFEDYLLTMDYPDSKLEAALGTLNQNDNNVVSFLQKPRVLNLNIDIAGNTIEAHLDTGNPAFITLPYELKDKLKFKKQPEKGNGIRTPAATFKTWNAQIDGDIKVGGVIYKDAKIILAEGPKTANLGFGVLKNLRTTIDRKSNLIKFEKQERPNIANEKQTPIQSLTYSGIYEGDRKISKNDNGDWVYRNAAAPIDLKLVEIEKDLYEMKIPEGVRAPIEIPKIQFIRNDKNLITSLAFIYKDGRKDGPHKKISN